MRARWNLLLLTMLSISACGEEEEEEEDDDRYTLNAGWSGTESLEIGASRNSTTVESTLCTLVWNGSGGRSSRVCDECEFVYDVDFIFDDDASSGIDGCPNNGDDYTFTYGFNSDYNGEAYLFYEYNGGFFPATEVDYDGSTMSYRYVQGARSFYYGVYRYLVYITYGEAEVR